LSLAQTPDFDHVGFHAVAAIERGAVHACIAIVTTTPKNTRKRLGSAWD